jgi:hypothetical protein
VVVICAGLTAGGYFAARQLGYLGEKTAVANVAQETVVAAASATAAALAPPLLPATDTPLWVASETSPPSEMPTQAPPEPLPTFTQPVVVLPTFTPTTEILPMASPTVAPAQTTVLFEDTFDNAWREHWIPWGNPWPNTGNILGDAFISLTADDPPGSAGMTSLPGFTILNAPGTEIEFEAAMDERYRGGVLILDWDLLNYKRGPENLDSGVIRLEVRLQGLILRTKTSREKCEVPVDAVRKHTYILRIVSDQGIELYLDDDPEYLCQLPPMALDPRPGTISFTGRGTLTRVRVSVPPSP